MTGAADQNADTTGLQAERTQLAWVRTALAAGALAAVATRLARGGPALAQAMLFGLVVALPGAAAALARIRAPGRPPVPRAAAPWTVALLAASLALADAVALALLVT
jgi:uncharacterized membrane protein YidH (DUF202 family)